VKLAFPSRASTRTRRLTGAALYIVTASLVILRHRADVYHSHNIHLALPLALSARLRRARFVYDAHELTGEMFRPPLKQLVTGIERRFWRRADVTITTNASRRRYLVDLYGAPDPTVIANVPPVPGVVEPVDLRKLLGIPGESRIMIYQGGFYAERSFREVALALSELKDWHFVVIGFGSPAATRAVRSALEDAMGDRSHILPAVPFDELLAYTAGADLGVIPLPNRDLNYFYGDTNKMFEYLMMGLPAVGSDFPELRRVLVEDPDGPLGAVFDPCDPFSIAEAVRSVEDRLGVLGERAQRAARKRYSWDNEQLKLIAAYASLIPKLHQT
jgi:glycosyltransferase involved in cell wall biosynthesis